MKDSEILKIVDLYCIKMAGGDAIGALYGHAGKAEINLKYIDFSGPTRVIAYKIFQAANGQGKISALIDVIENDGFNLTNKKDKIDEPIICLYPFLRIYRHINYIPTGIRFDNKEYKIFDGRIENLSNITVKIIMEIYITACSDIIKKSVIVPKDGINIPSFRLPRFTHSELEELTHTITQTSINIDLYLSGNQSKIDSFQGDILLSQPDIALISRTTTDGDSNDFSSSLAWWVNSGALGLDDLQYEIQKYFVEEIPALNSISPKSNFHNIELNNKVRAIYNVLKDKSFNFIPTEIIFFSVTNQIIQRIRSPETIIRDPNKKMNCLDGCILFASLLERMNLKPVLVLSQNHALVGWKLSEFKYDKKNSYRTLMNCDFIEITFICNGLDFDMAISSAQGQINKLYSLVKKKNNEIEKYLKIVDVLEDRQIMLSRNINGFDRVD